MDSSFDDVALIRAHECKLLQAVRVLEQVCHHLHTPAEDTRNSSDGLRGQALQAHRRSHELLVDAARLIAMAERLVAEARAIRTEYTHLRSGHEKPAANCP